MRFGRGKGIRIGYMCVIIFTKIDPLKFNFLDNSNSIIIGYVVRLSGLGYCTSFIGLVLIIAGILIQNKNKKGPVSGPL